MQNCQVCCICSAFYIDKSILDIEIYGLPHPHLPPKQHHHHNHHNAHTPTSYIVFLLLYKQFVRFMNDDQTTGPGLTGCQQILNDAMRSSLQFAVRCSYAISQRLVYVALFVACKRDSSIYAYRAHQTEVASSFINTLNTTSGEATRECA